MRLHSLQSEYGDLLVNSNFEEKTAHYRISYLSVAHSQQVRVCVCVCVLQVHSGTLPPSTHRVISRFKVLSALFRCEGTNS